MSAIDSIVRAVLYEGYMLYPYRPSSLKNRQRWTFGGVFPRSYVEASRSDVSVMQTECVVEGSADTRFSVRLGCLHLIQRDVRQVIDTGCARPEVSEPPSRPIAMLEVGGLRFEAWQEASEMQLEFGPETLGELCATGQRTPFSLAGSHQTEWLRDAEGLVRGALLRTREDIEGRVERCAVRVAENAFRVTVRIVNATPVAAPKTLNRDEASLFSLASCHAVLGVSDGAFVSSIDPPHELAAEVAGCSNVGLWPVLVGEAPGRDTMLAAPIILYDYPSVTPESAGDLFDATEIDEILTLRILTMTDGEKREMAAADERARALLVRTESLTADELQRLHGTLRRVRGDAGWDGPDVRASDRAGERSDRGGEASDASDSREPWAEFEARPRLASLRVGGIELTVGDRVLLRPRARADIFDLALRDQVATIESIERDFEDHVHVAVTVDSDPGREFGFARMPGHRFFFAPDEIEPVRKERRP